MKKQRDPKSASVLKRAKQAEQAQGRHSVDAWAQPTVWTGPMLSALHRGVKGGQWFSLIDKVASHRNLRAAFQRVAQNKGAAGVDNQTVAMFAARLDENIDGLSELIKSGAYQPGLLKRVHIGKSGGGSRPLSIPTVRDRVVQTALRYAIEPIFDVTFAEESYGFRPMRGAMQAVDRVQTLLEEGFTHVVDADIEDYFGSIPHPKLMQCLQMHVSDSKVLGLIRAMLQGDIMEGMSSWTPTRGAPQGAVISPLLSNVYLDSLDRYMKHEGFHMVRYADDFVILTRSKADAARALELLNARLQEMELSLHPDKTRIADATLRGGGFDFLGYHFEQGHRWPRDKSLKRFKDAIRAKTKRSNGHSIERIIARLNPSLRGWHAYFKFSVSSPFIALDKWIRMRLRCILKKRKKKGSRKGRAKGADLKRWNNAYFERSGLFSLYAAHKRFAQSTSG